MTYHYRHTPGDHRLIVTLHGTGGNENQFHGYVEQVVSGASILSPRGDVSEHGAARFFRRRAEGVYDMDDLWMRVDQMADFVRVQRVENVTRRCIGIGYSNGANILMATAPRTCSDPRTSPASYRPNPPAPNAHRDAT